MTDADLDRIAAENQERRQTILDLADRCDGIGYLTSGTDDVDDLVAEVKRLRAALKRMVWVESEPCRYDHNGFCQTHYSDRPCRVEEAKAVLGMSS